MDWEYDDEECEGVLSIIRGGEGWFHSYSSITDFKQDLGEESLSHENLKSGWVLSEVSLGRRKIISTPNHFILACLEKLDHHKTLALLRHIASHSRFPFHSLIQFWGVVKVDGRYHYLSSSHNLFYVSHLNKGLCWYRKLCRDHEHVVDVRGDREMMMPRELGCHIALRFLIKVIATHI
ncbi:protein NLP7-like [Salvia divinorum]|uniref:Protein NLP7-like n=1 Tax=Salvia divinorum TaxID=28513 RepID=A0ABD1GHI3_SALDI